MAWYNKPFEDFQIYTRNIDLGLRMNVAGLNSVFARLEKEIEAYKRRKHEGDRLETDYDFLQLLNLYQFASVQAKEGHPDLNGQAAIALWGAIDALVHDILLEVLEHHPERLNKAKQEKLTVRYFHYVSLDENDQREYLFTEVKRLVSPEQKIGVASFEELLGAFGLGGDIDQDTKNTLLEMAQVRNVLVHRAGIADNRILRYCPGLGLKQGDVVKVNSISYERYRRAVQDYASEVLDRIVCAFELGKV